MEKESKQPEDRQVAPTTQEKANVESEEALRDSRRRLLKAGLLASIPVLVTVTARPAFAATSYVTPVTQSDPFEMIDHEKIYHAQADQKGQQQHG